MPSKLLVSTGRFRGEVKDVSGSTTDNLVGELPTDDGTEGCNHVDDCRAVACSKIPRSYARLDAQETVDGGEMAGCEIDNVDIIADGCAILRIVV